MGHPAFRQQPAAGMIARSASSQPHTNARARIRKRTQTWRVYKMLSPACWDSPQLLFLRGKQQRERRRDLKLSSLLLSLASPAGNRPCTGLRSTNAFSGPCVRIFTPPHPPFLPHSFSQPGCIRFRRHRRHFLLLPPSDQPSRYWLAGCCGIMRLEGP